LRARWTGTPRTIFAISRRPLALAGRSFAIPRFAISWLAIALALGPALAATLLVARISRRARQHPALSHRRQRTALLALFTLLAGAGTAFGCLGQALQAHRLAWLEAARAAISAATATTSAAASAISASAAASAISAAAASATTIIARFGAAGCRLEIDQVLELADLLGAAHLVGGGEHAHEAHALGGVTDGFEGLAEPRQPIAGDADVHAQPLGELLGGDAFLGELRARLSRALDGGAAKFRNRPHGGADASMPAPRMDLAELITALPERIYYLTSTGRDMWCRRPYGFFFTSIEDATRFAEEMSELSLTPIGVAAREVFSDDGVAALRKLELQRVFIDPRRDAETGDVFGTILRIELQ
jgi:hypothetical protein